MKTIGTIIALLFTIHFSASAQDSLPTSPSIKDKIYVRGEGTYEGVITYDDKKDSITIVTDKGASTFKYGQIDKIEYNIARETRESRMYQTTTPDLRPQVQPYAYPHKLVSKEKVRKLRNASIILAAIGGGLHIIGFTMNAGAYVSNKFPVRNTLYAIGGISNDVGLVAGIADIGTWIAYAHSLKKYKRQSQPGK